MTAVDYPLLSQGFPNEWIDHAPHNSHSTAYEASRIVKAGQGLLYGFTVYNSLNASQFIQLFDNNAVPGNGAIPAWVITIATVADREFNWIPPRKFNTGIVICNSTTGPTLTIGAANCYFDCQYL